MSRDTCRYPGCDRTPGERGGQGYRQSQFCSIQHDVKFEHLKADARAARREVRQR